MNETKHIPWYCSWVAIIIAFFIFWPVGIVLLIVRNTGSKQSAFMGSTNKKMYIIAGVVLILVGLSIFSSEKLVGFFFIVGGGALIYYAANLAKHAERNRMYIDLIVNQGETSLDKIANMCNIQYDTVHKEIKQLIVTNVLKNATIDDNYRTINIVRSSNSVNNGGSMAGMVNNVANMISWDTSSTENGNAQASDEIITCKCPGCGAKMAIRRGTSINCEYCDTPITTN
jgi:predicted transcriptional regulator